MSWWVRRESSHSLWVSSGAARRPRSHCGWVWGQPVPQEKLGDKIRRENSGEHARKTHFPSSDCRCRLKMVRLHVLKFLRWSERILLHPSPVLSSATACSWPAAVNLTPCPSLFVPVAAVSSLRPFPPPRMLFQHAVFSVQTLTHASAPQRSPSPAHIHSLTQPFTNSLESAAVVRVLRGGDGMRSHRPFPHLLSWPLVTGLPRVDLCPGHLGVSAPHSEAPGRREGHGVLHQADPDSSPSARSGRGWIVKLVCPSVSYLQGGR